MLLTPQDCIERYNQLNLQEEYLAIRWLERKWWVIRDIPNPETVAEHSISAALMLAHRFQKEIKSLDLDISILQDTLLIHDIHEPVTLGKDITPHDNIPAKEKKRRELEAVHNVLQHKPLPLKLWMSYENGSTQEWKLSMEIDKLQALEQARYYKNLHWIVWLTDEFYTYAVITKKQIQTRFLLDYAEELMTNPSLVVISHFPTLENNPHE